VCERSVDCLGGIVGHEVEAKVTRSGRECGMQRMCMHCGVDDNEVYCGVDDNS
jgi:hypothetical protein